MNPNRVLLMQLSERTVAFPGEPDRWGNPTWDVFVSEPLPRPEDGQAWDEGRDTASRPEQRPQQEPDPGDVATSAPAAKPSARAPAPPVERGSGWRGSPGTDGHQDGPQAPDEPLPDDTLEDLYR